MLYGQFKFTYADHNMMKKEEEEEGEERESRVFIHHRYHNKVRFG